MGGARKDKVNILGDMVGPAQPIGPNRHVKSSDRLGMFGGSPAPTSQSALYERIFQIRNQYFLFSEMATADFRL